MEYTEYLEAKAQDDVYTGFDPVWMPDFLFDFQAALVDWAIRKGKAAIFADCGLGKTVQELVWAENVVRHTNGRVLILTPLAVSAQTIREGAKFGIECRRSHDGKAHDGITITNYEQLHKFDVKDFSGVVCDECFPAGTVIDTPHMGRKHIENIQIGDKIMNAAGIDTVADIHRREVQYAVRVTVEGRPIICSPNHPIFTKRGWVGAQDLLPGDQVVATNTALRMVRDAIHGEVCASREGPVLRAILLSEMADESAGAQSEGSHGRDSREDWAQEQPMEALGQSVRNPRNGANTATESYIQSGSERENLPPIESHEPQTFRAWGERNWFDSASTDTSGCTRRELGRGICFVTGKTDSRLSRALQTRLSECRAQNLHRGGWKLASCPEGTGQEKGRETGFYGVGSLEVLEPGHPDLEKYRDAEGKLYFYDLGLTRHPSFSVAGCLVHNSSILKSFDGTRRGEITQFMRKMPYRLLATATAAPNDYIELGTSSEALGYLGHIDMLNRFFVNDLNNSATRRMYGEAPQWRFKGHAESHFWRWVCSWARAIRSPQDLGFDGSAFELPRLIERNHLVDIDEAPAGMLFTVPATNMKEQRDERRRTLTNRCQRAAELVQDTGRPAMLWCHLNPEGDLLTDLIPGAVQVSGSDKDGAKEEKFLAFTDGEIRTLITKPKIGAWGLNCQHCAHVVYFPSHSYEQYYQAVRRCYRFGQRNTVAVDIILTEGERRVMENLQRKSEAAGMMFTRLVEEMNNSLAIRKINNFTEAQEVPSWL